MSVEKVHLDVRYNPDIIRGLIDDLTLLSLANLDAIKSFHSHKQNN